MTDIPTLGSAIAARLPWLSRDQMVEVDRAMVEDYGIGVIQMMELAGRHLAHLARKRFLHGVLANHRVTVLAGAGGNGGGALVCARRLANWGIPVSVFLAADPVAFGLVPLRQLGIVQRLGIRVVEMSEPFPETSTLVIDGMIGYGLRRAPRGRTADLIRWTNSSDAPILALDVPSGLHATTGAVMNPVVHATATMTLALPKQGLGRDEAQALVGELYLADIGVPPQLYARDPLNLAVPNPFTEYDMVRMK